MHEISSKDEKHEGCKSKGRFMEIVALTFRTTMFDMDLKMALKMKNNEDIQKFGELSTIYAQWSVCASS